MTYTLELPEIVQRVLEAKARRRGVALDALVREVLQREAASEAPEYMREVGAGFMAMLDQARPIIADGTLKPITSESVNAAIDASRDREYSTT